MDDATALARPDPRRDRPLDPVHPQHSEETVSPRNRTIVDMRRDRTTRFWWALGDDFRTLPLAQIVTKIPYLAEFSVTQY